MVFLANEVLQTEIRVSVLGLQAKSHVEQSQTCIAGMLYFFFFMVIHLVCKLDLKNM